MTRINLLDWRNARRDRRKREFYALLGASVAGAAAVVIVVMLVMGLRIDNQDARNRYLTQQIALIDKQIKEIDELDKVRANLLARMHVIEQLQQSRAATVHFFDEIVNTLPDGVYLTAIKQSGEKVTLQGVAESNGRVSAYMKNLDASPWFSDPQLVVIKTTEKDHVHHSDFTLEVKNLTAKTPGGKS